MDRRIGERQRWAWLAAGLSSAIGACLCGLGWIWVLAGGALVSIYYIYMDFRLPAKGLAAMLPAVWGRVGAIMLGAALLWTVLVMAWAANLADGAFPMVNGFPVLGWTLLAMAAWGSWKGVGACARSSGVLCLFLIALYGVVAVFAVPDMQWENLIPTNRGQDGIITAGVFLLPAAVWFVPCTRSRKRPAWEMAVILPLSAAALAAITAGVLSPVLAYSLPSPLYTLAQSVSLFGVVERIEPLLSAAMTMGVFSLLSAMACACRCLWEQFRPWRWSGVFCCIAAAALMGCAGKLDFIVLAIGSSAVWLAIPLLTLWIGGKKEKETRDSGSNG